MSTKLGPTLIFVSETPLGAIDGVTGSSTNAHTRFDAHPRYVLHFQILARPNEAESGILPSTLLDLQCREAEETLSSLQLNAFWRSFPNSGTQVRKCNFHGTVNKIRIRLGCRNQRGVCLSILPLSCNDKRMGSCYTDLV